MNIKTLLSMVVVVVAILLPSSASAAIPATVTNAYTALYGGEPYKTNFASLTTVDIFGVQMQTAIKGTGSQDADGDVGGTTNVTVSVSDPTKKGSQKKITFAMEFKYILEKEMVYFKFKKLPKELTSSLPNVRTNVWYSQVGEENLTKLVGESPFSKETFVAANEKYPAYVFKEKGSTGKESVYAYSVNPAMIQNFLIEQGRLMGDDTTPMEVALHSTILSSTEGTLRIDKKTKLPKSVEVHVGKDGITSELKASYIFGKIKDVTAPTKAIPSDALDALLGDM